jgi:alpha-glucosidase
MGQWYLHLFAPEQPDLDWDHPVVQEELDGTVRFWLDRGVDGIRVDAAPALAKVPGLPDAGHAPGALFESARWVDNPHWDRDEVHEVFRRWRHISDGYDGDRVFVSEAVVAGPERLAATSGPTSCTRASTSTTCVLPGTRTVCGRPSTGRCPRWRRWGRRPPGCCPATTRPGTSPASGGGQRRGDHGLRRVVPHGPRPRLRRARAAALLTLALPGGAYLYQGKELGLPEVEDLPEEALQDPA